jgi:tRNA-dihydrouridine synthase B
MDHSGEVEPRIVQIAGGDPEMLANAARHNVDNGAQIIDINMGCPAKRVCNAQAGSALLSDEGLVERILTAVVKSVAVPVTLKIRTGPDRSNRNGVRIARIAEQSGIAALAVHGRTRADKYKGDAEFDTIAEIASVLTIPLMANGDVRTPEDAKRVLDYTGADAVMIGRAAQGNPWIFREIAHYLASGEKLAPPTSDEVRDVLLSHLHTLYEFYGEYTGSRVARKHIAWYCKARPGSARFRNAINHTESCTEQLAMVESYFEQQSRDGGWLENERDLKSVA